MASRDFPDDFKNSSKGLKRDFDDLQNELAGCDTGRMSRFLKDGERSAENDRRRKNAHTIELLTNLENLLANDPEYAAAYHEFGMVLGRAEVATETAIEKAEIAFAEIAKKSPRLPDGRAVYKNDKGQALTEDGQLVDAEIAATIEWRDSAPSYQEYLEARKQLEGLRRYQVGVLGTARGKYDDHDNPITQEEMDQLERDIYQHPDPVAQRELNPPEAPDGTRDEVVVPVAKPPM